MSKDKDYEQLFQDVVGYIGSARTNFLVIKEKALLEIYWGIGEELLSITPLTDKILTAVKNQINQQLESDPFFRNSGTNKHWLKLSRLWVEEHVLHDKSIMLSGLATWVDWALVLDVVNSPVQRYWLICQKIKNNWDTLMLLREAQKLPEEYLNLDCVG